MTTTIQEEKLTSVKDEIGELLEAHFREINTRQDLFVLQPDWPRYEALEAAGKILFLTVREDGKLIGYSCGLIGPHLHYVEQIVYQNDVLYLDPKQRGSRAGFQLVRATEEEAKARGAVVATWHAKPVASRPLIKLLLGMRYDEHEIIYLKEL